MSMDDQKIMGFMPKDRFVKIIYLMVLTSCGMSLLSTILAMIGIILPLGGIASLIGVIALVLALIGFFAFKNELPMLDQAHLRYLLILFGIFFVAGLIVGAALFNSLMLLLGVTLIINCIQLLLFYTGYNSYRHGRIVGKDNLQSEISFALKRA